MDVRTTCPYCGVGCGLVVADTESGVAVKGDKAHPANFGRLCSKGSALGETIDLEGRLLEPSIGGRAADWDEALSLVAGRFSAAIEAYGPDSVAFYVSGQLLTEDYYVANKLMKGFIGSANIDTNSRLCMASAVAGYKRTLGADFVPASYDDIEAANLLVIAGANMAWCHPVLFQRARQAKEANPAMKVVVIDPRRTATCDIADLHLPIRPGSDVALFNGLLGYLDGEDLIDRDFVAAKTEGFDDAIRAARSTAGSVADVARTCSLPEDAVARFFRLFAGTAKTVTLFSQGINQSTSGTDKVTSIVNLHLATGRIGKKGAGPFSLTGQPNAMGGREVGGLANQLAAHMDFSEEHRDRVRRFWDSPTIAMTGGLKAVDLFEAVGRGEIRALWIMSTNPVVSMPAANDVRAALEACDFVAVSDCMSSTDTTRAADVLLPAAAWGEKSGTVTNSERRISRQRKFLEAPGVAQPDWWIVCEVAKRMGHAGSFDYASPADIFREHAALSAFENDGTRDFDIGALAGLSDEEYDRLEPVRWPLPIETTATDRSDRLRFFTPSGKARMLPVSDAGPVAEPDSEFPFVMLTGRVRDQWHTMTRSGKSPRLSQTRPEPFLEISSRDALALGIPNRALARVRSPLGETLARIEWSDELRSGEVFAPMHWSESVSSGGRVGPLIAAAVDPQSGQPELKATPIAVEPVAIAWYGFVLSRSKVDVGDVPYWALTRGWGFRRYELAGTETGIDWPVRSRDLLGDDGDWVEMADEKGGHYRGARLVDGRLTGCIFVSPSTRLPDRGWLGQLFESESMSDADRLSLLAGRPSAGAVSSGPLICACYAVGREALVRVIASEEATTVREIGELLKAGTNCGSCIPELNGLLAEHRPAGAAARAVVG